MRTCLAVFSVLALFITAYFFAHLEAERLLEWPDALYRWFDSWLLFVMMVLISLTTLALPLILALCGEPKE